MNCEFCGKEMKERKNKRFCGITCRVASWEKKQTEKELEKKWSCVLKTAEKHSKKELDRVVKAMMDGKYDLLTDYVACFDDGTIAFEQDRKVKRSEQISKRSKSTKKRS
jgi:hypothetical protein